ncbi:hypothetical protein B5M42_007520 [Paenibacillus athensensis]|uniref:Uncharacterized protein n=1 Tax=Paenibacillus athensensis TaxID=1967502 RepID=A0A4Y8Q2D1_9BACL|nr:hypothetical protein [Paenibacillus athensensis]MCD1258681.1 hypothetical protein [Paenibacillus athensensis]
MNFLEHVYDHVRSGKINNYPQPVALNLGLAYTMQLPDRKTSLFWLPYEFTGLAYIDLGHQVNIYPYYRGAVIEEVELSRGTDLHKPQTEEAFMKQLYVSGWELHKALAEEKYQYLQGSAADYIAKMYGFVDWLRYYNSARDIGTGKRMG